MNYIAKIKGAIRRFHAADKYWHDWLFQWTPFHPYFWGTWAIHGAVKKASQTIESGEYLLDAGCGLKRFEPYFHGNINYYLGLDLESEAGYRGNKADVFGDILDLPFQDGAFDVILCTEVLEHVKGPSDALGEMFRTMGKGGSLILTTPFCYPVHDEDDFWRFTPKGLELLVESAGFHVKEIVPLSGNGKTLAILVNTFLIEIGFFWTKYLYPIGIVFRPILWLLALTVNVLGALTDIFIPSRKHKMSVFSFNHLVLAIKP